MESIANMIMQQLGSGGISQVSHQLGADQGTTSNALQAAVPMLVSAMAQQAQQPQGAQQLHQTVQQQGQQFTGDPSQVIQRAQQGDAEGLLGQFLGGRQQGVQQGVSQATGLNSDQTKKLLLIAAPLVVGSGASDFVVIAHLGRPRFTDCREWDCPLG